MQSSIAMDVTSHDVHFTWFRDSSNLPPSHSSKLVRRENSLIHIEIPLGFVDATLLFPEDPGIYDIV